MSVSSSSPASSTSAFSPAGGFSAELAFREMPLNAPAFSHIVHDPHFEHAITLGIMPVLIFTIICRSGSCRTWIGLN